MSRMSKLVISIEEDLAEGYLSFGAIAEKHGVSRDDVEVIWEQLTEQYADCDDSDDGAALASAGMGTDEDYGYYGDE